MLWLCFLGTCTCLSGWSESLSLRKRGPGLLNKRLPQPWCKASPSERGPQCKEHSTGSQQTWNLSHLTTNEPLGLQEMEKIALGAMGASSLEMLKQGWLAIAQKCWGKKPAAGKLSGQIASKFLSNRTFPVWPFCSTLPNHKMMYIKIFDYYTVAWKCESLCSD